MRLWHKDLIKVLPDRQLLAQWRECCGIARNIKVMGHPNHILVNKIMDYPIEHFIAYSNIVAQEMRNRGFTCHWNRFMHWFDDMPWTQDGLTQEDIFAGWMTPKYLRQCFNNLDEKYDCGGMTNEEWNAIYKVYYDGYYR